MTNNKILLLKNNVEEFKKEAKKYFFEEKCAKLGSFYTKLEADFEYRVATNFNSFDIENVKYYPKHFEKTIKELIKANPYTQLMEVFGEYFGLLDIEAHLKKQDENLIFINTFSDAGSVKVGNDDFSVFIRNGYGDGVTGVFITSKHVHVPLEYFTSIKGDFRIYEYDLGEKYNHEISGSYSVFHGSQNGNGIVVFVKQE